MSPAKFSGLFFRGCVRPYARAAADKQTEAGTLSGWFRRFVRNTDLPDIHLHSLRHACATLEISNGIAVTTVAGQLGHANASTTTKIYAHAVKTAQAAAADMMDDLLAYKSSAG